MSIGKIRMLVGLVSTHLQIRIKEFFPDPWRWTFCSFQAPLTKRLSATWKKNSGRRLRNFFFGDVSKCARSPPTRPRPPSDLSSAGRRRNSPAQSAERWCRDRRCLDTFSRHQCYNFFAVIGSPAEQATVFFFFSLSNFRSIQISEPAVKACPVLPAKIKTKMSAVDWDSNVFRDRLVTPSFRGQAWWAKMMSSCSCMTLLLFKILSSTILACKVSSLSQVESHKFASIVNVFGSFSKYLF
jgi:hypothetical protein